MTNEPEPIDWKKLSDRSNKIYRFEKWIFRSVVFCLIILFGVSLFLNGFEDKVYAKCKVPNITRCENPFYGTCDDLERMKGHDESVEFAKTLCNDEFLLGSVVVGEPPTWFMRNYLLLVFGILALGFFINHLAFNRPKQLRHRRFRQTYIDRAKELEDENGKEL